MYMYICIYIHMYIRRGGPVEGASTIIFKMNAIFQFSLCHNFSSSLKIVECVMRMSSRIYIVYTHMYTGECILQYT